MKILSTVAILILLTLLSGIGLIYSGYINVGANVSHSILSNWLLTTAMHKSVKRHAQSLTIKEPELGDHAFILVGAENYDAMCAACHTPPGKSISPLTKGLNPTPPDLQESAEHMTAKELFWVTKNGIRMTGMPAWGLTHNDEEIWSVVAFIQTLPNLGPNEYKRMVELAKRKESHIHPNNAQALKNNKHSNHDNSNLNDPDHTNANK